jgi:hypothetical protein
MIIDRSGFRSDASCRRARRFVAEIDALRPRRSMPSVCTGGFQGDGLKTKRLAVS